MSVEVYPVIHVKDSEQTIEQASMAYELGADGVYLIDHPSTTTEKLIRSYVAVDIMHPDRFIGLNFLQIGGGCAALEYINNLAKHDEVRRLPDGLWADDASIMATEMTSLRNNDPALRKVKYLGGVAFKHTPMHTENPAAAAMQARVLSSSVDVVTTSGAGAGHAPPIEKAARMKYAINPQRLALASGINENNIGLFAPHVDEVLVASSIETEPFSGIFDEARLARLIAAAREE